MKLLLVLTSVCILQAQDPMSKETKGLYTAVKGYILKSAEKMPESNYAFKPSPEVRNYGAILGHLADDQYFFCSAAKGETKDTKIEKEVTSKAALVAELTKAFAYCDSAYDGLTDASGPMMMKFGKGERSMSGILNFNVAHDFEHYGNLITYLRIKGLVPRLAKSNKRYNDSMARGWESKSVESQVEARQNSREVRMPHRTAEQMEIERKSDSLLLQRVRVLREIESSSNARHRKTLEEGLKYLEDSLSALGWKK